jgi:hypothetical protein
MATLNYNGIPIEYCRINYGLDPQYDESGMDYLYDKVTVEVQDAIINPALPNLGLPGETTAQTMRRIEAWLNTPQKQLIVKDDGGQLVFSPAQGETVDLKNGPFPRGIHITEMSGTETYKLNGTWETYIRECPSSQAGGSGNASSLPNVLSNRWSMAVTIDQNMLSRREVNGKLVLRANASVNPDDYRNTALVPLLQGFIRQNQRYVVSEDGLSLLYSFVDQEVFNMPPIGLTKAKVQYRLSTAQGATFRQDVDVKVWANKKTPKAFMLTKAMILAVSRLNSLTPQVMLAGAITDTMDQDDRMVEVQLTIMKSQQDQTFYGLNGGDATYLDYMAGSSLQGNPPDPGTRGTADYVQLYAQILKDPCAGRTITFSTQPPDSPSTSVNPSNSSWSTLPIIPATTSVWLATPILQDSVYSNQDTSTWYHWDSGLEQTGKQSDTDKTSGYSQKRNEEMFKEVNFHYKCLGKKPMFPNPNDHNENEVLLKTDIQHCAPQLLPGGQVFGWDVRGRYRYGIIDPSKVIHSAPSNTYTTLPLTNLGFDATQMPMGKIAGLQTAPPSVTIPNGQTINPGGQADYQTSWGSPDPSSGGDF